MPRALIVICGAYAQPREFKAWDCRKTIRIRRKRISSAALWRLRRSVMAARITGLPFALSTHSAIVQHIILEHGSESQKLYFLPKCSSGEWIGAHAMTEPQSGSDAGSLQTQARKVDGGYRISGSKCMITLAPEADLFVLYATVKPGTGQLGYYAFCCGARLRWITGHSADR